MTVAVLANIRTGQGDSSMKSVRERVDMNAAYREVGSFRAAADICGTTPKTVKRAIKAAEQAEAGIVAVRHNYDAVAAGRSGLCPQLPPARSESGGCQPQ